MTIFQMKCYLTFSELLNFTPRGGSAAHDAARSEQDDRRD